VSIPALAIAVRIRDGIGASLFPFVGSQNGEPWRYHAHFGITCKRSGRPPRARSVWVRFRTVDVTNLHSGPGAPLVDVSCTGTAIRDFRRVSDDAAFEEGWVVRSFGEPPAGSMLVLTPRAPEGADLHG